MRPFSLDASQGGRACAGRGEALLEHSHQLEQPFKVRALWPKQGMHPLLPSAAAQPDFISSMLPVTN
jgi:hypothetical protein